MGTNDLRYDIPKKVTQKGRVNGITMKEMIYAGGLIMLGILGFIVGSLFDLSIITKILLVAICAGPGVFLVIPLGHNENALIKIRRWRAYNAREKRFYYKRYTG